MCIYIYIYTPYNNTISMCTVLYYMIKVIYVIINSTSNIVSMFKSNNNGTLRVINTYI